MAKIDKNKRIKKIFFDMDGTLLKKHPLDQAMEVVNGRIARETSNTKDEIADMVHKVLSGFGENYLGWDWNAATMIVARSLGTKIEVDLAKEMKSYLKNPYMELYPNAKETILALSDEGYLLDIATHGYSCYQKPVLDALGLTRYFNNLITPDKTKKIKTDQGFLNVNDNERQTSLVIGDSYYFDILTAKRQGLKAIWAAFWLDKKRSKKLGKMSFSERARYVRGASLQDDSNHTESALETYKKEFLPDATILDFGELKRALDFI